MLLLSCIAQEKLIILSAAKAEGVLAIYYQLHSPSKLLKEIALEIKQKEELPVVLIWGAY